MQSKQKEFYKEYRERVMKFTVMNSLTLRASYNAYLTNRVRELHWMSGRDTVNSMKKYSSA